MLISPNNCQFDVIAHGFPRKRGREEAGKLGGGKKPDIISRRGAENTEKSKRYNIYNKKALQRTQRKAKDTIFIIKKLYELCVPERSGREEKIFHTEARKRGSGDF